ncbi:MAG TPA: hypothetical protein VFD36_30325, partial [Kofleriaceae bacterium]|nr:hypothetical protein [Kofleriaceae bacterium]
GGAHASGLERVLDGHRHAVQRAEVLAASERAVGLGGARPGAAGVDGADGIQRRVVLRDPREVKLDELSGREVARADTPGELGGAGKGIDALV